MSGKNGKHVTTASNATEGKLPEIKLNVTPAVGKPGRHVVVAVNGIGELHRNTMDLNSDASRKKFVTETLRTVYPKKKPDELPDELRTELARRLLAAASVPPGTPVPAAPEAPPDDPRVEALAKMPPDVRAEAVAMLNNPRLVERVKRDIAACGVVGESLSAFTLYLVGTSAQLDRPLAAITRGSSSSGKSYVVDRVSSLFPPEVVLHATSITTNALYYFPPGTLRHRWVVCGERSRVEDDDRAEATRALREMIEAGKLSKAVPNKDGSGRIVTEMIEQAGPIAFIETTTLTRIFEEDANRCLLLASDETEQQTRKILEATAQGETGEERSNVDRIRDVHHAVQRMIPRSPVIVPFASSIAHLFPADRIDSRRSFRHLLQLVKAVTLLHFQQRTRTADGGIVATLADYQIAEQLASAPLAASRGDLGDATRKFFEVIHAEFDESEFDSNQAQAVVKLSRSVTRGRLTELNDLGVIEQVDQPKGNRPARWRVTGICHKTAGSSVPGVDDVRELFSIRTQDAER